MLRADQFANIRQLLTLAYLVVAIPAIAFVMSITFSIDHRIKMTQSTNFDAKAFADATHQKTVWLFSIGRKLREINAPLSVSSDFRESGYNQEVAQDLSDLRAALIYICLIIFLIGALIVCWLSNRLNQPLTQLSVAIRRLARDELVEPVDIKGPKSISEISDGLNELRLRLMESDALKTQFLRHISHEIKTPLTSIKEGSQLLEDEILGPINSEQREITEILNKSTKELQNSIESLLSYNSALSLDKVKKRQNYDLGQLVKEVIEKQTLAIMKKSIIINLDLQPARAFIDPHQAMTVFDNLLSNAIKFSPENGVIKIWLKRFEGRSEFIISDNGPGVAAKHKTAIFDAFFVGKQPSQNTLKGTGLGLSIARQYVELHNGKIELLPTRKGAAFRVIFVD